MVNVRILAAFLLLGGCHREKAVDPLVLAFINEGALVRTQATQGVDLKTFGLQVARAKAAFDVAYPDDKVAPVDFFSAMIDWQLVLKLRKSEQKHKTFFGAGVNQETINGVRAGMHEPPIDYWVYLEIHPYVEAYSAEAAECFERGLKMVRR